VDRQGGMLRAIDRLSIGIYRAEAGMEGVILEANDALARLLGYEGPEDLVGRRVVELYREPDRRRRLLEVLDAQGYLAGEELQLRRKDGGTIWASVSALAARDEGGRPIYDGTLEDCTHRRGILRELEKYRISTTRAMYGLAMFDPSGHVMYCNPAWARMHGAQIEEVKGRHVSIFHGPKQMPRVRELFSKAMTEGGFDGEEVEHLRRDGQAFSTLTSGVLLCREDGSPWLVSVSAVDVSDRKRIERDLREARVAAERDSRESRGRARELEEVRAALLNMVDDLAQKERDLSAAREQLAGLNRTLESKVRLRTREVRGLLEQKERFIRQLGHDLKTPLTPLAALLPMLRESLDKDGVEVLSVCVDNVDYMRRLVDNTLTLLRYGQEGEGVRPERIDLMSETRAIAGSIGHTLDEAGVTLVNEITSPLEVWVDRLGLREVLLNLLSNAVKYMGGEGIVRIRGEREAQRAVVHVEDTGMGLTGEEVAKAFAEFYKADESRHDRSSSGLGLSICERILSAHGERIWIASEGKGKGTRVSFTLHLVGEAVGEPSEEDLDEPVSRDLRQP
jgi:PAS domain S-box-containing protein